MKERTLLLTFIIVFLIFYFIMLEGVRVQGAIVSVIINGKMKIVGKIPAKSMIKQWIEEETKKTGVTNCGC